ncbi:MAG: hypothetical protein Q4G61_02945 [Tissierellia bacterium]|nr:hypothetical protein [Tissierellia bacterium]
MILLSKNDAFQWHEREECYIKGYFYNDSQNHEKILQDLLGLEALEDYEKYIQDLNGEFSILRETDDFLVAAVDFARSYPLFYSMRDQKLIVSDSPNGILKLIKEPTVDEIAVRELRIAGTAFGNRTLYQEIQTLGCGEILYYDKRSGSLTINEYMSIIQDNQVDRPLEELVEEADAVYSQAVLGGLDGLRDRTIVIPLTSGWWERILVRKLKELGFEKVICYTYGGLENPEVALARGIAEYYEYPWYFIEYKAVDWFKWFTGPDYRKYRDYCSQLVTIPNISEYLAVKALMEKRMVPADAIFVNVCFTNILRGEEMPTTLIQENPPSEDILRMEILDEIASNIKWQRRDYQMIGDYIEDIFNKHADNPAFQEASASWKFRYAYWKERTGKNQTNSRRIYEMYHYQWRNIQLEKGILEFWERVPDAYKYTQRIQQELDLRYEAELLEYIGISGVRAILPTAGLKDFMRSRFPGIYRRLSFLLRANRIKGEYDHHPMLWYNILSRREFEHFSDSITNIHGALSVKYLRDFCKDNNYQIK